MIVSKGTITRPSSTGRHWEIVVGLDVPADKAAALVAAGEAEWGPDRVLPPLMYLRVELEIRGVTYPAGAVLHVGREDHPGRVPTANESA